MGSYMLLLFLDEQCLWAQWPPWDCQDTSCAQCPCLQPHTLFSRLCHSPPVQRMLPDFPAWFPHPPAHLLPLPNCLHLLLITPSSQCFIYWSSVNQTLPVHQCTLSFQSSCILFPVPVVYTFCRLWPASLPYPFVLVCLLRTAFPLLTCKTVFWVLFIKAFFIIPVCLGVCIRVLLPFALYIHLWHACGLYLT